MRTPKEQLIAVLEKELEIAKKIPDDTKLIAVRLEGESNNVIPFHCNEDFYEKFYANDPDVADKELENVTPDDYMEFDYDEYWRGQDYGNHLDFLSYIENNNVENIVVWDIL